MLALTTEISELNKKVSALHQDALKKDTTIEGQNREIMYLKSSGGQQQRDREVSMKDMGNLINTKSMSPKIFHGKPEESYKTWAKKVRAYCNANRPGFKKFLLWIERQETAIDIDRMDIEWKYKDVAAELLHDFLVMHQDPRRVA